MSSKIDCRIIDKNGYIINSKGQQMNPGNGDVTWFTFENAKKLVDYSKGQQIRIYDKWGDTEIM